MVLPTPCVKQFSKAISFMDLAFSIAWKIPKAVANVKKHISKNRATILQGLIKKSFFNWVYLLQIWIITRIET